MHVCMCGHLCVRQREFILILCKQQDTYWPSDSGAASLGLLYWMQILLQRVLKSAILTPGVSRFGSGFLIRSSVRVQGLLRGPFSRLVGLISA